MSERFGPNFAPGSFTLQQSIRLVYTLRALSRGQNRATRATRDNQDAHTQRNSTHTLGNGDETQQPARDYKRALAAAAAAPPPPPPLLLLLLLLLPLCCCAVLLLHDPRRIAEHNPSQQTVSRFVFFGTHAEASNGTAAAAAAAAATAAAAAVATAAAAAAAAQQQQVQQQGRPKHMYEYTLSLIHISEPRDKRQSRMPSSA